MLTPTNQIGTTPQVPLALLQRPIEDWLRVELEIPAAESTADRHLSQIPLLFLRQLSADARLRAELEADPVATLEANGVHVAPEQIPEIVSFPSPEALDRALRFHATGEDEAAKVYWVGFLGGLLDDDLNGLLDD